MDMGNMVSAKLACAHARVLRMTGSLRRRLVDTSGQATTEYAILVGVLVVIAILAITLFRPKIEELWSTIADSINAL